MAEWLHVWSVNPVLWSENDQEPTVILYPDIDLILINTHP